tara:strand:+ start:1977 stop:2411 length:435 start_codon:yes stop_codon:yes gene_type:complete
MKTENNYSTITIAIAIIGVIFLLSKKTNKAKTKKTKTKNIFSIGKSQIEGKGVFANKDLYPNEYIGDAVTNVGETKEGWFDFNITKNLGIWINHQSTPKNNSKLVKEGNKYVLRPLTQIRKGDEITIDYDLNPSFLAKSEKHYK